MGKLIPLPPEIQDGMAEYIPYFNYQYPISNNQTKIGIKYPAVLATHRSPFSSPSALTPSALPVS